MNKEARTLEGTSLATCQWCGCIHPKTICPRARAIDYYPDGSIKRVEFWESPKVTRNYVSAEDILKNWPR